MSLNMSNILWFDGNYIDTNGHIITSLPREEKTMIMKRIMSPKFTKKGEFKLFDWYKIETRKIHSCHCDVDCAAQTSCGNKFILAVYCANCLTLWFEHPYDKINEIQINIVNRLNRIYIVNDIVVLWFTHTVILINPNNTTTLYENCISCYGQFIISKNEYVNWIYKKNNLFVYVIKLCMTNKTKLWCDTN